MIERYNSANWGGGARSYGGQGICSICAKGMAQWQIIKGEYQKAYCDKCKLLYIDIKRVHNKKWALHNFTVREKVTYTNDGLFDTFFEVSLDNDVIHRFCVSNFKNNYDVYNAFTQVPSWGNPPYMKYGRAEMMLANASFSYAVRKYLAYIARSIAVLDTNDNDIIHGNHIIMHVNTNKNSHYFSVTKMNWLSGTPKMFCIDQFGDQFLLYYTPKQELVEPIGVYYDMNKAIAGGFEAILLSEPN